jgi:hypothetical protein
MLEPSELACDRATRRVQVAAVLALAGDQRAESVGFDPDRIPGARRSGPTDGSQDGAQEARRSTPSTAASSPTNGGFGRLTPKPPNDPTRAHASNAELDRVSAGCQADGARCDIVTDHEIAGSAAAVEVIVEQIPDLRVSVDTCVGGRCS